MEGVAEPTITRQLFFAGGFLVTTFLAQEHDIVANGSMNMVSPGGFVLGPVMVELPALVGQPAQTEPTAFRAEGDRLDIFLGHQFFDDLALHPGGRYPHFVEDKVQGLVFMQGHEFQEGDFLFRQ